MFPCRTDRRTHEHTDTHMHARAHTHTHSVSDRPRSQSQVHAAMSRLRAPMARWKKLPLRRLVRALSVPPPRRQAARTGYALGGTGLQWSAWIWRQTAFLWVFRFARSNPPPPLLLPGIPCKGSPNCWKDFCSITVNSRVDILHIERRLLALGVMASSTMERTSLNGFI